MWALLGARLRGQDATEAFLRVLGLAKDAAPDATDEAAVRRACLVMLFHQTHHLCKRSQTTMLQLLFPPLLLLLLL